MARVAPLFAGEPVPTGAQDPDACNEPPYLQRGSLV